MEMSWRATLQPSWRGNKTSNNNNQRRIILIAISVCNLVLKSGLSYRIIAVSIVVFVISAIVGYI